MAVAEHASQASHEKSTDLTLMRKQAMPDDGKYYRCQVLIAGGMVGALKSA